ncbi:MAG: hypothetical protein Ct9H300mP25_05620 [Acidobacteriota bacterium]|nr:MAG: hypothetical protein Ct9H300mP25_05620 [Acidobacteriota bacterium]
MGSAWDYAVWQAELRPHGIRVTSICPSEVQTDWMGSPAGITQTSLRSILPKRLWRLEDARTRAVGRTGNLCENRGKRTNRFQEGESPKPFFRLIDFQIQVLWGNVMAVLKGESSHLESAILPGSFLPCCRWMP